MTEYNLIMENKEDISANKKQIEEIKAHLERMNRSTIQDIKKEKKQPLKEFYKEIGIKVLNDA
jgi:hypothetical protein